MSQPLVFARAYGGLLVDDEDGVVEGWQLVAAQAVAVDDEAAAAAKRLNAVDERLRVHERDVDVAGRAVGVLQLQVRHIV